MVDVQFNYMHECFERVFCELKWRKEVRTICQQTYLLYYKPFIYVFYSHLLCVCFYRWKRRLQTRTIRTAVKMVCVAR